MKYTTFDYLRDLWQPIDMLLGYWERKSPKFKNFYLKILDANYEDFVINLFSNIPYALIIIFLGYLGVFAFAKMTQDSIGIRISTVTTNSMSPTFEAGSMTFSVPVQNYLKNDVVTFREVNSKTALVTGRTVTHRIIDIRLNGNRRAYITKGDSNPHPDPGEVYKENILGKVILAVPLAGYLDVLIRTVPGFLVFVVVPFLIIIRNELGYIRDQFKK